MHYRFSIIPALVLLAATAAAAQAETEAAPVEGDMAQVQKGAATMPAAAAAGGETSGDAAKTDAPPAAAGEPVAHVAAAADTSAGASTDGQADNAPVEDDDENEAFTRRRPVGVPAVGIGIDPYFHEFQKAKSNKKPEVGESAEMQLQYHGYLRVPFVMGFGDGKDLNADTGSDDLRLHSPPQIPDIDYLDWRFTNNNVGPWVEIYFSYGNQNVAGTVGLMAYSLTDGGYAALKEQLGIDKAFVTLHFPDLFGDRGGLITNVGVFNSQYGVNEQYEAGKYDTVLFGTTHMAGIQSRAYYDVNEVLTLHLEGGFGGKLAVEPFQTNPQMYDAPYLPYGGDVEIGATFMGHGHFGVSLWDKLFIGAHYMHAFSRDRETQTPEYIDDGETTVEDLQAQLHAIDADLTVWGFEIKGWEFLIGDFYLGYAHHTAKQVLHLGGVLESIHSWNGYDYGSNYFKSDDVETAPNGEEGKINTIMGQYTLSLARILWYPQQYWGQSADLRLSAFGMLTWVDYDKPRTYDDNGAATDPASITKFKWGAEALFTPLSWFGVLGRVDMVQPDMDDKEQSINVLSGGVQIQSNFISNEQIRILWSQYFNGDNVVPGYPYNEQVLDNAETLDVIESTRNVPTNDWGVLQIQASMWW